MRYCSFCKAEHPLSIEFFYFFNGYARCKAAAGASARKRRNEKRLEIKKWRAEYYAKNPEQAKADAKKWRENNKERAKTRMKDYYQKNKSKFFANVRVRSTRTKRATPAWVDTRAIEKFYDARPDGYHVDHIEPLNGKDRCGLHVPWNLQYLPALDNLKKGNRT